MMSREIATLVRVEATAAPAEWVVESATRATGTGRLLITYYPPVTGVGSRDDGGGAVASTTVFRAGEGCLWQPPRRREQSGDQEVLPGKATMNSVNPSSSLSTVIVPPWAFVMMS